jgi:hypothetical protein
MNIDNSDSYTRIRGTLAIVTIFFATLIAISILYDLFPNYLIPMSRTAYALTFGGFFILFLIYRTELKYQYIIYNDENNKIILRYYPFTSFFNTKYTSIEIPFNSLYKIEIQKVFFNRREELIIFQTLKEGVAKYKPIPLTALTKKEKNDLIQSLNHYARIKMQ